MGVDVFTTVCFSQEAKLSTPSPFLGSVGVSAKLRTCVTVHCTNLISLSSPFHYNPLMKALSNPPPADAAVL